ncbi:hypothetical protein [Allopontixanthobacter sediminis]|uniref:Uncharacterized protein n=1 Tax=Allopontixanthobacter sediminis TaxID=1689985 RepID=A0A845B5A5_9SPHN|nr:hypothetical protein [Allopontixanthobacter sediminis]MXP45324.1 hypothetical protein [Allopontixanthobacter sediminis]
MTDFPTNQLRSLTELQAFDVMIAFLESYWQMHGKSSDDIANLLSDVSRNIWANGSPGDPASWSDWQNAVSSVLDTTSS